MTEIMGTPLNTGTSENLDLGIPVPTDGSHSADNGAILEPTSIEIEIAYATPTSTPDNSLTSAFRKTGEFSARIRNRAIQLKNEQPLEFLAIIAGVAVAAGAAARIWRSSQDA